ELERIIDYSDKKRFEISDDGEYIRAGYGHSIDLDLGLDPVEPPGTLYHGTAERNVSPIMEKGLDPQNRNYVHLSADRSSAREVGMRHGKPVIISVDAGRMHEEGHAFYQSESEPGIWLTEEVPPEYVSVT
ncbi:MAG: RNA 2'-phosphotransferase, partial [Balneolaceae bacterium]|nr:RNA 2'-phosphotransferase [Balneolaceae bacterium]